MFGHLSVRVVFRLTFYLFVVRLCIAEWFGKPTLWAHIHISKTLEKGRRTVMNKSKSKVLPSVMGFYHEDGHVPAWKQATKFAGKNGRIGVLPDVIEARLATKPGDVPWETYFTTLTAEYLGFSKGGTRILIVVHGIGPMATLDGILKAYSFEFKDKERNRRGGRITHQEFLDLESGKYGEVQIVDFEAYCQRYQYPFLQILRAEQAMSDPVLKARLGPRAEKYVEMHRNYAREWHREQAGVDPENKYKLQNWQQYLDRRGQQHMKDGAEYSNPFIIEVEGAANCCYTFGPEHGHRPIEDGLAIAHLISMGGLCNMHHEGNESLVCNVSCHEWWNGVRLLGIRKGAKVNGIHQGARAYELLRKHWKDLMKPVEDGKVYPGFCHILQVGEQWFTDYPKQGESMDNWEPEFLVQSVENIGEPVVFKTTIGGYHGFFRYGIQEIKRISPPEANAYSFTDEPQCIWEDGNPKYHTRTVQFHRIAFDPSQRLMRVAELVNDYDLLMQLVAKG